VWRTAAALSSADPLPASSPGDPSLANARPALRLSILASRWNWRITYPGGVVQAGDGRERFAVLVVPADRLVRFRMTSRDVVHALWIPALAAKYDAIPGRTNVFDLRFAAGRDYRTVRCSEFCGDLHDQMRLRVDVRPPAAFDAWLRARQRQEAAR